jgi:hypothetical protein
MAGRIRTLKPEILDDSKCAALSHLEYRLFVGSILIADDHGNLRGDPDYIRGQIVWGSRESRETVASALETLARVSLLVPYTVRGQLYLHVAGWAKHQKVDKPSKPRMPGPDEDDCHSNSTPTEHSRDSRETLASNSRDPRESLAPDLRPPTSDPDPDRELPPRAIPPSTQHVVRGLLTPEELAQRRELGRLAESMWQRVSDSRMAIAAELGLTGIIPLQVLSPVHEPDSFRELRERLREEGPAARAVCDHVHAVLCAQARTQRDLEWLGEKAFLKGAWREARNGSPDAPLPARTRHGPRSSAERAPTNEPIRRMKDL